VVLRPQVACPSHVSSQHHVSVRCCEYFTEATDNIRTASPRANAREKRQQPQGLSERYDSGATAVPVGTLPRRHARSADRFSDNRRVVLLSGTEAGLELPGGVVLQRASASHMRCGRGKYLEADPIAAVRTSAISARRWTGKP
jgi:hypothetical protein